MSLPTRQGASALPAFDLSTTVGQTVVRLPTAAPRQVRQRFNRHTREPLEQMRSQWKGRMLYPHTRAALKRAELIRSVERTPALCAALAMFKSLDEAAQRKALTFIKIMALTSPSAAQAVEIFRPFTVAEEIDLAAAYRILDED
jgi:hypothetical protein